MKRTVALAGAAAILAGVSAAAVAQTSTQPSTPPATTNQNAPSTSSPGATTTTTPGATTTSPQTTPSTPGTSSTGSASGTVGAAGPVPGANSFTEDQARERITGAGFQQVTGLKKDDQGIWRGKAMKGGKQVDVSLDYRGNVNQAQ